MMLVRAARQAAFAGLSTALMLGFALDAAAQTSECPNARVSGRARPGLVPTTLLSVIDNAASTNEQLQLALNDCQLILRDSQRGSVDALMCVARAQIRLADRDIDPGSNYGYARCHAYRAARLGGAGVRTRADALRADALVGLMRVNAGSADDYSRELLRDVHNAQASDAVHRAVADMYVRQRNAPEALREARAHLQGTARALTLINISNMPGGDSRLLDEAYASDSSSVAVNSALGIAYFNRGEGDWGRAWQRLEFATRDRQTPEPGYESLQLDAFYYRSVLEASNRGYGTLRDALVHADQAGNTQHALRQACLVRLMIGGEEVYRVTRNARGALIDMSPSTDGQRSCQRLGSSPEGQLLEGMYWLRYSQFRGEAFSPAVGAPGHAPWREAVNTAERAFENGRDALGADNRTLGWPGWGSVSLRAMLGFGNKLADLFQSYCQGEINANADELRAGDVFVHYKIVRAPGRPNRCLPPERN